jgi:hypothetical protein
MAAAVNGFLKTALVLDMKTIVEMTSTPVEETKTTVDDTKTTAFGTKTLFSGAVSILYAPETGFSITEKAVGNSSAAFVV